MPVPPTRCSEARRRPRQRGDALLEALVGMLIVGLVASASVYAIARGSRMQYSNQIKGQIVDQVRDLMQAQGMALCGTSKSIALPKSQSVTATFTCQTYAGVTVTLPGLSGAIAATPGLSQVLTATIESSLVSGGPMTVSATAAMS
jgi:prepilin peptidase dependent protein A